MKQILVYLIVGLISLRTHDIMYLYLYNTKDGDYMKNEKLKPDSVLKDFWRNNDRFADLFNQIFFHGAQQITPDKLTDKDTEESTVIMGKGQAVSSISRARDVIKQYDDGIDFVLVGIENQMRVHYAMPVRSMVYEALNYSKQCKELEQSHRTNKDLAGSDEFLSGLTPSDKIKPTITLVVYYGEKPWDGPTSLSDMMDIPDAFRPFFNNYSIHLLQVRSVEEYRFQNPDNRDFFTLIEEFYNNQGKIDIESFKKKYPNLDIYWETLAALGAATGSTELVNYALNNEGGNIHMCTALENLKKEGIREGILEVVKTYREVGYPDDIILTRLIEKFHLSTDEAKAFL